MLRAPGRRFHAVDPRNRGPFESLASFSYSSSTAVEMLYACTYVEWRHANGILFSRCRDRRSFGCRCTLSLLLLFAVAFVVFVIFFVLDVAVDVVIAVICCRFRCRCRSIFFVFVIRMCPSSFCMRLLLSLAVVIFDVAVVAVTVVRYVSCIVFVLIIRLPFLMFVFTLNRSLSTPSVRADSSS